MPAHPVNNSNGRASPLLLRSHIAAPAPHLPLTTVNVAAGCREPLPLFPANTVCLSTELIRCRCLVSVVN